MSFTALTNRKLLVLKVTLEFALLHGLLHYRHYAQLSIDHFCPELTCIMWKRAAINVNGD